MAPAAAAAAAAATSSQQSPAGGTRANAVLHKPIAAPKPSALPSSFPALKARCSGTLALTC